VPAARPAVAAVGLAVLLLPPAACLRVKPRGAARRRARPTPKLAMMKAAAAEWPALRHGRRRSVSSRCWASRESRTSDDVAVRQRSRPSQEIEFHQNP